MYHAANQESNTQYIRDIVWKRSIEMIQPPQNIYNLEKLKSSRIKACFQYVYLDGFRFNLMTNISPSLELMEKKTYNMRCTWILLKNKVRINSTCWIKYQMLLKKVRALFPKFTKNHQ